MATADVSIVGGDRPGDGVAADGTGDHSVAVLGRRGDGADCPENPLQPGAGVPVARARGESVGKLGGRSDSSSDTGDGPLDTIDIMGRGRRMSTEAYQEFLARKQMVVPSEGITVADKDLHPLLFPFQRDITRWALQKGRAAIFADCGLGKTLIQLEWAKHVVQASGGNVLIVAPLAVSRQTVAEGQKLDISVALCRTAQDVVPGINITNYERMHYFQDQTFAGIVVDESSILKGFEGATRKALTDFAQTIPYRLACTATPAPNDLVEIINHAEFLGIMHGKEIIALFFTQDGNTTHAWRLKGHAQEPFWRWMASWAVALRKPSDMGYDDGAFVLPSLQIHQDTVASKIWEADQLFPLVAVGLQAQQQARRQSLPERVKRCADRVNATPGQWIVWCDLNAESEALCRAIPDAREIRGSDDPEVKERLLEAFSTQQLRVLVTKPSIAGFGLNWQQCHQMAFVGLSNSYEQVYQAIRRCWRFGQQEPVEVVFVTAETEGAVVANIQRKEAQATAMMDELVRHVALSGEQTRREEMEYGEYHQHGSDWDVWLGDSVQTMDAIPTESIAHVVTSPPFPGMYAYTNSVHDMGNVVSVEEMLAQFRFLVDREHLGRIVMPGRIVAMHLTQLTAMKSREGWIGIKDYRGALIALMQEEGWIYHGEVTVEKNPQIQATRNKERGLLFKSLATDSAVMRMALADYVVFFRKPGENPIPIRAGISKKYNPGGGWITEEEWIEWASPVWYRQRAGFPGGIRETDVLNVRTARDTDDERHLAPLQLGVIERCIKLFSAPGETVYDPFTGIGSTGYVALKLGRRFAGGELKPSYFQTAVKNLQRAERLRGQQQLSLFDGGETGVDANPASQVTDGLL